MKYAQRDLVRLNEEIVLPDGVASDHPILIISCSNANQKESSYTGVLMSATSHNDRFSFHVDNEMFEAHLNKSGCQFRTYIIVHISDRTIDRKVNTMLLPHFKALLESIKSYVLCSDK